MHVISWQEGMFNYKLLEMKRKDSGKLLQQLKWVINV